MKKSSRTAWIGGLVVLGVLTVYLAGCTAAGPGVSQTATPQINMTTATQPMPPTAALPTPERTLVVAETLVPEETVIEVTKSTPENPYVNNLVQQAQKDLAVRLNVPVDQIEFLKFEDMVWPDGSLGCPMPGMEYTQVLVEGYRILLQHAGQTYAYHGGGSRPPFLCQNPQK